VVLFGRFFLAQTLCVLSALCLGVPGGVAQTAHVAPWERCMAPSEGDDQCTSEGRLIGRALSDAYTLHGISGFRLLLSNSPVSVNDRSLLQQEGNRRALSLLLLSADFGQAIDLDPNNQPARVCRGMIELAQGTPDPAIIDFTEALRTAPSDYDLLIARARAYAGKQYFRRTLVDLNRAIEIDPMRASAFGFRGDVYRFLGWPGRAYADYANAVKREPDLAAWVERRDAVQRLLGRRGKGRRSAPAGELFATSVFANFARGHDEPAVRDTLERWEAGDVSLQEARLLFEGATPRCVLNYL
jgi:tetratricopeptide (TPR) repeat protein